MVLLLLTLQVIPPTLALIHLANHRLNLGGCILHCLNLAAYIKMENATTTASGKILVAEPETPNEATPPPSTIVGDPISAAAAKTAGNVAEAAMAKAAMGNSGGVKQAGGGEIEVQTPGISTMPSGGNGPTFANNYADAVKTLHELKNQGAQDGLADAPAMKVATTMAGGGESAGLYGGELEQFAGAIGKHWKTPMKRYHPLELAKGVKHELEHTDDHRIALEIAKDHLAELPDYYTRLEAMVKRAESSIKKKRGKTKKHGRGNKRTHRRS